VRFEDKNTFFLKKNIQAYYNAGVEVANSGASPMASEFTTTAPERY
jgi:hypothetical protein